MRERYAKDIEVRIATRFKSIDPEITDEFALFDFEPLPDITSYELALITKNSGSNYYDVDWLANAPISVLRHFRRVA